MAIFNSYFDITRGYGGLSAPPWSGFGPLFGSDNSVSWSGFGKSGRGEETSVKQQRTWWSLTIWLVVWNHGILWLSTYKMGMENHPNWRTHSIIFQRGRAQPPTRIKWMFHCRFWWLDDQTLRRWVGHGWSLLWVETPGTNSPLATMITQWITKIFLD